MHRMFWQGILAGQSDTAIRNAKDVADLFEEHLRAIREAKSKPGSQKLERELEKWDRENRPANWGVLGELFRDK
jgi:hypothetical protein